MSTPTPRRPAARLRLAILLLATGLVASPVLEARPPAEPRPPAPKRLAFLCVADRRLPLLPGDLFLGEVVNRLLRFAAPVGDTLALDDVCGGAGRWLDDCGDAGRAELLAHAARFAGFSFHVFRATLTVQSQGRVGGTRPAASQHVRSTPRSKPALWAARKVAPSSRGARSAHTSAKGGSSATWCQAMPCRYVNTKDFRGGRM